MAIKESDIPPIRGNRRIGHETATDASVVWGGAKGPEARAEKKRKQPGRPKGTGRRRKQLNFVIRNEETLRQLSEKLGIPAAAVVNLGIAELALHYLKSVGV